MNFGEYVATEYAYTSVGDEREPGLIAKGPTNHVLKDGPDPKMWIGVKNPEE